MSVFIEIQLESGTSNKASLETPERVNPASVARRSISQPENQKKMYKIWHHYGQRFSRHFLKWLCVFTWYTKVLLLCTISLHFNFFSLYTRRIKIKKSVKNMHEHASRLTGKMKMRSRDCTEHRHTKIIHFSPWCEVSIVPPPPPRTICHPFPSYEVSS